MVGSVKAPAAAQFVYKGFQPEKANVDSKGTSIKERLSAYSGSIHNRNIDNMSTRFTMGTLLKNSKPKVATFLLEQQMITKDNISFIKSDATKLKKAATYLIGSTISGVADTLFSALGVVVAVVKTVFDVTIGMLKEAGKKIIDLVMGGNDFNGNFSAKITTVKDDLKRVAKFTNQVVRNVIRAVPVVGHFLGEAFDKVELSIIDRVEVAAHKIGSAISSILPASNTDSIKKETPVVQV